MSAKLYRVILCRLRDLKSELTGKKDTTSSYMLHRKYISHKKDAYPLGRISISDLNRYVMVMYGISSLTLSLVILYAISVSWLLTIIIFVACTGLLIAPAVIYDRHKTYCIKKTHRKFNRVEKRIHEEVSLKVKNQPSPNWLSLYEKRELRELRKRNLLHRIKRRRRKTQ